MKSIFGKLSVVLIFAFPFLWLWLKLIKVGNITSLPAQIGMGIIAAFGMVIGGVIIILFLVVLTAAIRMLFKKISR